MFALAVSRDDRIIYVGIFPTQAKPAKQNAYLLQIKNAFVRHNTNFKSICLYCCRL